MTYPATDRGSDYRTKYTYGFEDTAPDKKHGDLVKVEYSSNDPAATPLVSYAYDRLGRRSQVLRNGITTALGYNDVNQPLTEGYTGGTLGGFTIASTYNNGLQRDSLSLNTQPSPLNTTYTHDSAGRLWTVSQGDSVATYNYIANSMLVGQITFAQSGTSRMTTTKNYDKLNRLTNVVSSAASALGSAYQYNDANQRMTMTNADNSFWTFGYDPLGQVTAGKRYWGDRTPVAGQQFEYTFDSIGNRNTAGAGGDANGANLHYQNYTADYLNRYSSRTVPGYGQMLGSANASATVTLWGPGGSHANTSRKGDYFWGEISVGNGTYAPVTNVAVLNDGPNPDIVSSIARTNFLPASPESFGYDLDGNLTSDGRWNYTWDGENRLIRMVARTPVGPQQRLDFEYDWQGRRIGKKVWDNTAGTGNPSTDFRFLYDSWNLLAVPNASSSVVESFVWGSDLSGTLQGAGGVGGLLEVTYNGTQTTNCFAAFDGNGNVRGMVDAASGTVVAQYEYGP